MSNYNSFNLNEYVRHVGWLTSGQSRATSKIPDVRAVFLTLPAQNDKQMATQWWMENKEAELPQQLLPLIFPPPPIMTNMNERRNLFFFFFSNTDYRGSSLFCRVAKQTCHEDFKQIFDSCQYTRLPEAQQPI